MSPPRPRWRTGYARTICPGAGRLAGDGEWWRIPRIETGVVDVNGILDRDERVLVLGEESLGFPDVMSMGELFGQKSGRFRWNTA